MCPFVAAQILIEASKTVETVPGVCAEESSIEVPYQRNETDLYYCYTTTSLYNSALRVSIGDDQLGWIIQNEILPPHATRQDIEMDRPDLPPPQNLTHARPARHPKDQQPKNLATISRTLRAKRSAENPSPTSVNR